jgi:uncharacterized protein (TIGR02996 family)
MTSDRELLAAIQAAPDDPAPRLVYADHLLARRADDPHAELINVMHRLAPIDWPERWENHFSPDRMPLRRRMKELLIELNTPIGPSLSERNWKLGFVDTLAMGSQSLDLANPIFAVVRGLQVPYLDEELGPVRAIAHQIRRLEYFFGAKHLEACPNVREVVLPVSHVTAILGRRFESVKLFTSLRERDTPSDVLQWIPRLGAIDHLSLETDTPVSPAIIDALAAHEGINSVQLNLGSSEALRAIQRNARAFTRIAPQKEPFSEKAALNHFAIANAYLEMVDRQAEAIFHFKEAYVLSAGKLAQIGVMIADLDTANPEYDGTVARVPSLLMLGYIDRVLAAAPNHRGAWAMKAIRELDPKAAIEPYTRALGSERLGRAFAMQDASAIEPNDPFDALMLQNVLRGRIPDGRRSPLDVIARGLFEVRSGATLEGERAWESLLGGVPLEGGDAWLGRVLAATLLGVDPGPYQSGFRGWIATNQRIEPQPHLAFEVVLRLAKQVLPEVDLRPVAREIDRLRAGR